MTDKEKIKEEIERRLNLYESQFTGYELGRKDEAKSILEFIDSLPEEPASEGIEDELERFAYSLPHSATGFWPKDIDAKSVEARTKYGVHHDWSYEQVMNIARHFTEWQKHQMKGTLQTEYEKGRFDTMQDFLEKAERYLRYRVYYNTHPNNINVAIEDFKNYMQNESEN